METVVNISKSSLATGPTGIRPVKSRVTLAFQLSFKVIVSCRHKKMAYRILP